MKTLSLLVFCFMFEVGAAFCSDGTSPSARQNPELQVLPTPTPYLKTQITHKNEKQKAKTLKKIAKAKKSWVKRQKKIKKILANKQIKSKKVTAIEDVTFEDAVVLAGAVVVILGIISIIFSPISALISIALGLAVYLIGKTYGGNINTFFN